MVFVSPIMYGESFDTYGEIKTKLDTCIFFQLFKKINLPLTLCVRGRALSNIKLQIVGH